jgi:hypothetical protein
VQLFLFPQKLSAGTAPAAFVSFIRSDANLLYDFYILKGVS